MKRFVGLLVVAMVLVLVLVFITNPELISTIWLYLVGFIGYIVALGEKGFRSVKKAFIKDEPPKKPSSAVLPQLKKTPDSAEVDKLEQKIHQLEGQLGAAQQEGKPLAAGTVTVLRYMDDGETTLGLLFLRNKFFAYTLEDTFRVEKVKHETRIPAGKYQLDFNRQVTPMTERYRHRMPWFDFHLEIKDVPDFSQICIHIGNTHSDTSGCVLIADGVSAGLPRSIVQSTLTYEKFYKIIHGLLQTNEQVTIQVHDEDWIKKSKIATI
ncbi:hypothetical protein DN752_19335 [Echinicola strongylocentroti]|uniref:DUF5675 domain-containing protein n=1 Tax=Echinicola strongylocentroti TaxID=1795355 RepID=A0A2Z4IN05_9BACT|nr:DUF5675 family protein [Echinicola strongylocentroti]AWW32117.1 hypothetical protein DN752_19335 [Echinicola strongylocentroti]